LSGLTFESRQENTGRRAGVEDGKDYEEENDGLPILFVGHRVDDFEVFDLPSSGLTE
jgi:hypothetical protein